MFSEKYGRVEVKSARLPLKTITYNQCHPYECEYFLFVNYDTENGGEEIFFIPSKDIINNILEWKKVVIQFLVQRKRINNPLLDIVL